MKKIITTLFIATSALIGFGQTIKLLDVSKNVVSNTIIDVYVTPSSSTATEIMVNNTSASSFDTILVYRTIYSMDAADQTQFCWGGLCYGFSTNMSGYSLAIAPQDTIDYSESGFHSIFNTGTAAVTRLVHYKFYNKNNSTDSTGVTIRYNYSTGINEVKNLGTLSDVYPNPASTVCSVKYDIFGSSQKGRIVFYDMLGKQVKEVLLNDKQGTANINIADLTSGVYFYKFMVDNKAVSTKKIVITAK